MKTKTEQFNEFRVNIEADRFVFFHLDIADETKFYKKMFHYFFNEKKLLNYFENKKRVKFNPSQNNFCTLYKKLRKFVDDYNCENIELIQDKIVKDIIINEFEIKEELGIKYARIDKIGKIGEYIFGNILSEYFGLSCIIPKLELITSKNMSVFGIDTLYYSPKENMLFFGESKVTKSLDNGITLINKSLVDYEIKIKDEYLFVIDKSHISIMDSEFKLKMLDYVNKTINFDDFVKKANIKIIGIPLFIAHGSEMDSKQIMKQLSKIKTRTFCDLETKFIIISLPIINKEKMVNVFTEEIIKKVSKYEKRTEWYN